MVFISIVSSYISSNHIHSAHPSSRSAGGGRRGWVEPSNKFLQTMSLTVRRELPKKGGVLGQFADLREGTWQKREGFGVGDNPMYTMNLAIPFNCDFKLLMPMPSLLISNKKKYYLAIDWLLIITFDVVRRSTCKFQMHYLDKRDFLSAIWHMSLF